MIKNIFSFLIYCWSSWELWQKGIILSVILNVGSLIVPKWMGFWMSIGGFIIIAGMILFYWIHHMLLPKWAKYKEDRNQLLNTIKNSDT